MIDSSKEDRYHSQAATVFLIFSQRISLSPKRRVRAPSWQRDCVFKKDGNSLISNKVGNKVEVHVASCPVLSLFCREEPKDHDTILPYTLQSGYIGCNTGNGEKLSNI